MNFEICAVNLQSALAAQAAGAQRIELCMALDVGGLTPSAGLIAAAVEALDIPVHVLIRPREGDFCYTEAECDLMIHDVQFCKKVGAAGVVVGALTPEGALDTDIMGALRTAAGDMDVTCHRAFDFAADPKASLDWLVNTGFVRVLSSGQAPTAYEGRMMLKSVVEYAGGRIAVMPGGGVNAGNIAEILRVTGAKDIHFTGKKKVNGAGKADLPGLESWHWESDVACIRDIIENALNR